MARDWLGESELWFWKDSRLSRQRKTGTYCIYRVRSWMKPKKDVCVCVCVCWRLLSEEHFLTDQGKCHNCL